MEKRTLPKFKSEAEEAQWWYDHREEIGADILAAVREGRTSLSSPSKRLKRLQELEDAKVSQNVASVG